MIVSQESILTVGVGVDGKDSKIVLFMLCCVIDFLEMLLGVAQRENKTNKKRKTTR